MFNNIGNQAALHYSRPVENKPAPPYGFNANQNISSMLQQQTLQVNPLQ
jgi:hypothetical protein